MDLLRRGLEWLERERVKHASRAVHYVRAGEAIEVRATIGKTVFEILNDYGVAERTETRDYLVLARELVLAGAETTPKRGDQVRERQGTTIYVYEVMAPGREPEWRYSDLYRHTFRIHTKQVAAEEAP
ncbi:MAG TPA: hypothetical protein PK280_18445 [Planctomycetota bacterium]|nr:hypothetical protein [Planctomycetota bacterium]